MHSASFEDRLLAGRLFAWEMNKSANILLQVHSFVRISVLKYSFRHILTKLSPKRQIGRSNNHEVDQ
jgi:hypothetical protein